MAGLVWGGGRVGGSELGKRGLLCMMGRNETRHRLSIYLPCTFLSLLIPQFTCYCRSAFPFGCSPAPGRLANVAVVSR